MVSSMSNFDGYIKELLWNREMWETNFTKAAGVVCSYDDFETLRTNIRRMRNVLDNCDVFVQESEQMWEQSTALRKSSIKSPSDHNGTLLASNSSSERSSNGSPFQFSSAGDVLGSGCFSNHSLASDEYYDPMASLTDILTDSNHEGDHGVFSLSDPNGISYGAINGLAGAMAQPTSSYWPSFGSSFGNSPATGGSDLFSAFASSPKPSFAAVAQLPAAPDGFQTARKSSDASPTTVVKFGPVCITETPVLVNQQKPHLAKIIYVFPLGHRMDENSLEKYFGQFGRVSKVKIFRYPNGASKTAGIIDFDDSSSASLALKKKYHTIDGCQIESKPFEPKSHDPTHVSVSKVITRSSHFVNNTEFQVFIGGIPSNATDEDIEKSITVFGKVKRIQVNPNGTFAFVSFSTEADAQKIVGIHSINIAGKLVEVKRNQPQPQRPRANTSDSTSSAGSTLRNLKNSSSVARS